MASRRSSAFLPEISNVCSPGKAAMGSVNKKKS